MEWWRAQSKELHGIASLFAIIWGMYLTTLGLPAWVVIFFPVAICRFLEWLEKSIEEHEEAIENKRIALIRLEASQMDSKTARIMCNSILLAYDGKINTVEKLRFMEAYRQFLSELIIEVDWSSHRYGQQYR